MKLGLVIVFLLLVIFYRIESKLSKLQEDIFTIVTYLDERAE